MAAIFELARPNDGIISTTAGRLAQQAKDLTDLSVLYDAGQQAVLSDSNTDLLMVQGSFHKLISGNAQQARYANEVAGRLVMFCAAVRPTMSRAAWTRWWDASQNTPPGDRVAIALRIGAAALPTANLSLAVEVAIALAPQDFDVLHTQTTDPKRSMLEGFLSESYGRLLGTDAEQRILDFIEFARTVCSAVIPSTDAAS
jgi:hypothetical protein